jgi:hypothetical protein
MKKWRIVILRFVHFVIDREWLLNDGQIQNPAARSTIVPRGLGFLSIIQGRAVLNLNITIRHFFIAVHQWDLRSPSPGSVSPWFQSQAGRVRLRPAQLRGGVRAAAAAALALPASAPPAATASSAETLPAVLSLPPTTTRTTLTATRHQRLRSRGTSRSSNPASPSRATVRYKSQAAEPSAREIITRGREIGVAMPADFLLQDCSPN